MVIDPGQISVEHTVIHEIPKQATGTKTKAVLSDAESALTPKLRNFLQTKLAASLGRRAFDVEVDPLCISPVPPLIDDVLARGEVALVGASQKVASHLADTQTAVNSSGLLVVFSGHHEGRRATAILKLEKEDGARVKHETKEGKRTIAIEYIDELFLSGKTRVFKAGVFVAGRKTPTARVSDSQRVGDSGIATFFLKFLGYKLKERPSVATQRYFNIVQDFINSEVDDPVSKARYHTALLADVGSNATALSPRDFAHSHLGTAAHRARLLEMIEDAGLSPTGIPKDLSLIKNLVEKTFMSFEHGISVLVPHRAMGEQVQVSEGRGGRTVVQVNDVLTTVRGKR